MLVEERPLLAKELVELRVREVSCCILSDFQEHLCLMGVPMYHHLAAGAEFPPWNFENASEGILKKMAGNEPKLNGQW